MAAPTDALDAAVRDSSGLRDNASMLKGLMYRVVGAPPHQEPRARNACAGFGSSTGSPWQRSR